MLGRINLFFDGIIYSVATVIFSISSWRDFYNVYSLGNINSWVIFSELCLGTVITVCVSVDLCVMNALQSRKLDPDEVCSITLCRQLSFSFLDDIIFLGLLFEDTTGLFSEILTIFCNFTLPLLYFKILTFGSIFLSLYFLLVFPLWIIPLSFIIPLRWMDFVVDYFSFGSLNSNWLGATLIWDLAVDDLFFMKELLLFYASFYYYSAF